MGSGDTAGTAGTELTGKVREQARVVWDHQRLNQEPRRCDTAVVLDSHDPGVAACAADPYRRGYFPRLVITGANSPSTLDRFPRGEAVHYREHALELGVPGSAILVEPEATNTGENLRLARALLEREGIPVHSVMLVCKPYTDTMVGDLQRVMEYPARGFAVPQEVPDRVREAYAYLVAAGFVGHLIKS